MYPRSRFGSSNQAGVDGESLQADVMRFMAIIGFCLVAIMALVRDVNPPSAQQQAPQVMQLKVPQMVVQAEPKPARTPARETTSKVATDSLIEFVSKPVIEKNVAKIVPVVPKPVRVAKTSVPAVDSSEPLVVQEESKEEDGLSLRFHSDRDFLRLITSGEVGLYLFRDQTAFRLAKNYAFQEAPAPRQLYELLPQTIPAAISASANAAVSDAARFKWGVVMPAHIEKRIASLVAVESNGQLVIDRFGAVRHETAGRSGDTHVSSLGGQG